MSFTMPTPPGVHAPASTALETAAASFALMDIVEAEVVIDAHVAAAIAAWRLEDATYWQRVKFRARLIRTIHRVDAEAKSLPIPGKEKGVNNEPA